MDIGDSRYVLFPPPGEHFMKLYFSDFHQQVLKAIEILASYWLRANLLVKITDKMFHETLHSPHTERAV